MFKWLENFAYRTSIHVWVFFAAGMVAFIISLITVGIQAHTAAKANLIKSLRAE
jgi:putative ABC transport system permease protein